MFQSIPLYENSQPKKTEGRKWEFPKQPKFSSRLPIQMSLASGSGAKSEFCQNVVDPNPILDTGCPKSVGGMQYAVQICNSLQIPFQLESLDCTPFYHGYGMHCSESQLFIGKWRLPMTDLRGNEFHLPFYIVRGNGYLLIGNNIAKKSKIHNSQNLIIIPANTENLSNEELILSTYHSEGNRTRLLVLPPNFSSISSFFNSVQSFKSSTLKPETFT